MKNKKIIVSALLALGLAASAQAALISVGLNDLVLGFNKTSGTGSTSNVEVVLGNVSEFKTGGTFATGTEQFLPSLSLLDLNSTFGTSTGASGWKSTVTSWAVVGTNGAGGGNTLWGTQTIGEAPGSSQGAGATQIQTMYGGLNGKTSTANSNFAAVIPTANGDSFKTTSSGNFSYWTGNIFRNDGALANAGGTASINLYEYVEGGSSATLLGSFKLYDTGSFSFTSPIPEPSTYAAVLGAAVLGLVMLRRRNQAALV